MSVAIAEIEDRLAEQGIETYYDADDDFTAFVITSGDKEVTIFDAVSGDSFKAENLTKADYYFGLMGHDVTRKFEDVETVDEFLNAVTDAMSADFMPR
jgi:hypothetical protein